MRCISSTPLPLWVSVVVVLVTPLLLGLSVAGQQQFSHPDDTLTKPVPPITPVAKGPPVTICAAGSGPASVLGSCGTAATTPVWDFTNGAGCCPCPVGSYSYDGLSCKSFQTCVNGRVSLAGSGVDITSQASPGAAGCVCIPGYGDYDVNAKICRKCPVNTYSLDNKCVACDEGKFSARGATVCVNYPLQSNGVPVAPPAAGTQCSPGSALDASGSCTACELGKYSPDGLKCRLCFNGKTPNNGNIDVRSQTATGATQCKCLPGYGDWTVGSMACRQCPINTYSSTDFKCTPCPFNTFAPRTSSSCTAVQCPTGYYMPPGGTVDTNCVKCGLGTNGRVCGSMSACKCAPGFANFDRRSGVCFQCRTRNSISIYANMTNPDDSRTVCKECPKSTAPIADRRTCVPIAGASSDIVTYPSTPIEGLTCGCQNGFDITFNLYSDQTLTPSSLLNSAQVLHSMSVDVQGGFAQSRGGPNIVGGSVQSFIVDQDSGSVIGALTLRGGPDRISLSGSNYYGVQSPGQTCTASSSFSCLNIKLGDSTTKFSSLVSYPSLFSNSGYNGDANLNAVCANDLTYLPSATSTTCSGTGSTFAMLMLDTFFGVLQQVNFGQTGSINVVGTGTSNFGQKVIAFYTQSDKKIKFAITQALGPGIVLSSTGGVIGGDCPSLDPNVIACYPITNQWLPLNVILNGVDSQAVDTTQSDIRIVGYCSAGTSTT